MAQKLGIVIILFILVGLSAAIYWHLKFNRQPQIDSEPPSAPIVSDKPVNGAPAATTPVPNVDKPQPTEAQIEQQVATVLEKIKVEGASRRLTSSELMYLSNPRQAAISDLTK